MIDRIARSWLCIAGLLLAGAVQAGTLTLGVVERANDPRLAPEHLASGYLGHPGGPIRDGVEVALKESKFSLDAAGLGWKLAVETPSNVAEAREAAKRLQKAGAQALVADLPADELLALAQATQLPVFNVGEAADALRQQHCGPNMFHVLPSERMRADAMAQFLASRRWMRILLLHGPSGDDKARLAVVQSSAQRHGLKLAAVRPFELSTDPRKRQAGNALLLTSGVDYDVVWVVDSDGEFARSLPYRASLPRPVVGDAGLVALAWAPYFERYGAPQLAHRFERAAHRPMLDNDWAAWMAAKTVVQAALSRPQSALSVDALNAEALDGFKGVRVSYRAWDRQLRQPLLLTDGQGVIAMAPAEGVMHPANVLDTLGADAAEGLCKTPH
ncbi:ABC transporter substrate-binding protein [Piscinibacter terrae]|uniref:Branched-chain amino acid ABC transporter substrate-binding protein n=1 Tax=Piscinibacter terrae TaxID=2496871 RepID=A0A3N7K3X5_9BURK|nr:ABC transporter substrate-binding protein [Albitalea terrae]RQP25625.1 branched-chain amino acid ABC transporter substrate-binding protein [Albitalea terrae]